MSTNAHTEMSSAYIFAGWEPSCKPLFREENYNQTESDIFKCILQTQN